MSVAIVAERLTKRYGDLEAVKGIDFSIGRGVCFSFLGPNGAGKSSTIRMISCLSPITSGRLDVLGMPAGIGQRRIKERLGVVSQDDNLDPAIDVMENLLVYARYFGVQGEAAQRRALELLDFMQLGNRTKSLVRELSGGLRRRLVIARSLMNRPEILILDEPTTGLDPQARLMVWTALQGLKEEGVTIVLTTHYMEEAQRLADQLVVMDHGTILARGTAAELVQETVGREAVELFQDPAKDDDVIEKIGATARLHDRRGDAIAFYGDTPGAITDALHRHGVAPERMLVRPANLEDVFLTLTGRELRD